MRRDDATGGQAVITPFLAPTVEWAAVFGHPGLQSRVTRAERWLDNQDQRLR